MSFSFPWSYTFLSFTFIIGGPLKSVKSTTLYRNQWWMARNKAKEWIRSCLIPLRQLGLKTSVFTIWQVDRSICMCGMMEGPLVDTSKLALACYIVCKNRHNLSSALKHSVTMLGDSTRISRFFKRWSYKVTNVQIRMVDHKFLTMGHSFM
jgi:hypothetical protein